MFCRLVFPRKGRLLECYLERAFNCSGMQGSMRATKPYGKEYPSSRSPHAPRFIDSISLSPVVRDKLKQMAYEWLKGKSPYGRGSYE
jgi:hypothetical protein